VRLLLIDNYDSFTYNLFHILEKMVSRIDVVRNDELHNVDISLYQKVVVSPGPGLPNETAMLPDFILSNNSDIAILGICLGHQLIGELFGCKLLKMKDVKHGEVSFLDEKYTSDVIFSGINNPIQIGHYHSWVLDKKSINDDWELIAQSNELVMGVRHKSKKLVGLQFHPESIMTPDGEEMLKNWLEN
jgi:anthranilate synthase component II